jgi:signal transduction histidine kinase
VTENLRPFAISAGLPLATACLAATIFIVDTITKADLAFGALYVGVVLLASRFCTPSRLALVAVACVGLTIFSFIISPHGETTFEGVANTLIGISVIGVTTLLVLTNRDTRERMHAEEALRDMQVELAHANRVSSMGQLTASVAHEVTQPITAARANARAAMNLLAQKPPELVEVREALGSIVNDMGRAGDIIGRIRDHIKKAGPRKESFDLNSAILGVIALARSELTRNDILVETRLPPTCLPSRPIVFNSSRSY